MRRTMVIASAASSLSAAALASSCGSVSSHLSARYSARTTGFTTGTLIGTFDWTARRGHAIERSGRSTREITQIGDRCFTRWRYGWNESKADDVDGLCEATLFPSPAFEWKIVRKVADRWENLGRQEVEGVETTHYRGHVHIGAVKSSFDAWIDGRHWTHRVVYRDDGGGSVTTMRFFGFGVNVDVKAPTA